jgi:hypothetical protein
MVSLVGELGAVVCGAGHGESVGDCGVMLNRPRFFSDLPVRVWRALRPIRAVRSPCEFPKAAIPSD